MSLASYHCSTPGSGLLAGRRWCTGRRGRGCLPAAAVTLEYTRRRELAQFVADHVFGHEQLHELPAVVNLKRLTDKFRHNRAIAGPGAQRLALVELLLLFNFFQQSQVYIWTFFDRPAHRFFP